jgi:hypothetical protein
MLSGLSASWRFLIIVGLLFVMVGMPVPLSSRKTSLTFASPSYRTTNDLSPRLPDSEVAASHLSEPSRIASFPASVWFDARWPTWEHGYFARLSEGDFPSDLVVYDRSGKPVSQAHVSIPGSTELWLVAASPTSDGGAIASGLVAIDDGSTFFLAETSVSGGVVSELHTETFLATRMCTASDSTVWTLGRDSEKESEHEGDYPLVRQYSFEKGLLHSYLSRSLVDFRREGVTGGGEGINGTFLVCGKDRISLYLNETNEYFEIDPSKATLKRWKMAMGPLAGARVTGLAVTDKGRVYASLFELQEEGDTKTHGLFELRAEPSASVGKWIVVNGTLNSQPRVEDAPKGSFFRLWGADGEDLVIRRLFDADMSWVRVNP